MSDERGDLERRGTSNPEGESAVAANDMRGVSGLGRVDCGIYAHCVLGERAGREEWPACEDGYEVDE